MRLRDELAASKSADILRMVCSYRSCVSAQRFSMLMQKLAYGTIRDCAFDKFTRLGVDANVSWTVYEAIVDLSLREEWNRCRSGVCLNGLWARHFVFFWLKVLNEVYESRIWWKANIKLKVCPMFRLLSSEYCRNNLCAVLILSNRVEAPVVSPASRAY